MQFARLTDVTLHYQVIGNPAEKPAVVFANALGTDLRIWRDVAIRLADRFALLMYDKRGHGLSDIGDVPYTMPLHAADLAALMDHTRFRPALIVGASVGGLMDEAVPSGDLEKIRQVIAANAEGAIEAHDLRTRHAGRAVFVDFHLVVPGAMAVSEAHAICDRIERALKAEVADALITIHVEPEDKAKHHGVLVL